MKKTVSVLGSTGSIGMQALDVIKRLGYSVAALAAGSNIKRLEEQARAFQPQMVCIFDETLYQEMKKRLKDTNIRVTCQMEGLCEAASYQGSDLTLNAVVGMIGLLPTLEAIQAGKNIALANKETLVTGGKLVMEAAKKKGVSILPVDSEHSAIFQSLQGSRRSELSRILLTASGGPFYGYKKEQLHTVRLQDALKHPNWKMGKKITVDSATLMNKGLELIEAAWLFGLPSEKIDILVHRQSVLHSAVEFCDGAVIGQMGTPDMRIPIQYALTYPDREPLEIPRLSLLECKTLTFDSPDEDTFICLKACKESIRRGGLFPTIVNAANEEAVEAFLKGRIPFWKIGILVESSLNLSLSNQEITFANILSAAEQARNFVRGQI